MKIVFFLSFFLITIFLNACSGHFESSSAVPLVYKTGGNTHSITLEAGEDIVDMNELTERAYRKAEDYCESIQKRFQLVNEQTSQTPFYPGNPPHVTLIFRCY